MTTISDLYRPRQKDAVSARDLSSQQNVRARGMKEAGEASIQVPFAGITAGGVLTPGLFPVEATGLPTAPIRDAALAWLASLDDAQRAAATFAVDDSNWRLWSNVHMYLLRHGVSMEYMSEVQKERTFDILRAALSPFGFETSRNIMRLNDTVRELTQRDIEFGEFPYWMSIFGDPSGSEPWGWQFDGHHLIINCLVAGDQIVMTPMFMGSEPTVAPSGKYAGTSVFGPEDQNGLVFVQSLDASQKSKAVLGTEIPEEVFGCAYRDNMEMNYEGLRLDSLTAGQKDLASAMLRTYTHRMREDHADLWLNRIEKYLDQTYFAWMGGTGPDDVFYYRVHSPVVLIEFDHLKGIALENDVPTREHIHTIVRTPNGNDYGFDLLRQHREQYDHSRA